jgi:hypothetical protein
MVVNCIIKPAAYMELPPIDTPKFNVDGAHNKKNGFSACCEMLKDSLGGLIMGFYCNLSRDNSLGIEMWSLVHIMRIALHIDQIQELVYKSKRFFFLIIRTRCSNNSNDNEYISLIF